MLTLSIVSFSRRYACASINISSHREYSQSMRILENPTPSSLKRGTGGRSSFNGIVCTVFGATGFIGNHLVNELGKTGTQVIVPYRSDPDDYNVKSLKLYGDLGQILFQPFHLKDPASIMKAIKYSNVVVNLIGSHYQTKNFDYEDVHIKGAREIAKACSELGVERLIHVSALVNPSPEKIFFGLTKNYLPTKLKGEKAVLEEFPDATIIRPGTIYGKQDSFLRALNQYVRWSLGIPVWKMGKNTVKQPLFVTDLAKALVAVMKDNETKGKIFQAVGNERFLLYDIVNHCGRIRHHTDNVYAIPAEYDIFLMSKIIFHRYVTGLAFHYPRYYLSFEQLEIEAMSDNVDPAIPTIAEFGLKLTRLEDIIPHLIRNFYLVKGQHHTDVVKYAPTPALKPYNPPFLHL